MGSGARANAREKVNTTITSPVRPVTWFLCAVGVYTYAKGDRYEGDYVDNQKHGRGVYTISGAGKYEGEFSHGVRSGRGFYEFQNGDQYEGYW